MAFATTTEVSDRLGRDLTAAQTDQATSVIDSVTGLIVEVAGKAEADLTAQFFKALCVEKAIQVISRPEPAIAAESLGEHSVTYARGSDSDTSGGVFLTPMEERTVRRIANNAVSGSTRVPALPHDTAVTEAT